MAAQRGDRRPGLTYSPLVPDGPDRPWTRGRRTRWWLVVPADLAAALLVALFAAASLHDASQAPALAARTAGATALAWVVAWGARRGRDHLEVLWPEGAIVVGVTWGACAATRGLTGGEIVSFSFMTLAFLVVFQAGWRCLYGFAKAHDSLVPKAVQRRLDAQEARGGPGGPVAASAADVPLPLERGQLLGQGRVGRPDGLAELGEAHLGPALHRPDGSQRGADPQPAQRVDDGVKHGDEPRREASRRTGRPPRARSRLRPRAAMRRGGPHERR